MCPQHLAASLPLLRERSVSDLGPACTRPCPSLRAVITAVSLLPAQTRVSSRKEVALKLVCCASGPYPTLRRVTCLGVVDGALLGRECPEGERCLPSLDGLEGLPLTALPEMCHSYKNSGERRESAMGKSMGGGGRPQGACRVAGHVSVLDSVRVLHTSNQVELSGPCRVCSHLSPDWPHPPGWRHRADGKGCGIHPVGEIRLGELASCSDQFPPDGNGDHNATSHVKTRHLGCLAHDMYSREDRSFFVRLTEKVFGITSHSCGRLLELTFSASNNSYLYTSDLLPRSNTLTPLMLPWEPVG